MHCQRSVRSFGNQKAFTLIELLVVIAVIVIVVSLLVPALQTARHTANRSACANNLYHIGLAYQQYLDNSGTKSNAFVGDEQWMNRLLPYVSASRQVFICLDDPDHVPASSAATNGPPADSKSDASPLDDGRIIVTVNPDGTLSVNDSSPRGPGNDDESMQVLISAIPRGDKSAKASPPLEPAVTRMTGSYGINNAAQYFTVADQSQKVLAIEYKQVVANVVGLGAPDFWPLEHPRHTGMLNVLFLDGSVRDFAPSDMDPRVAETYRTHWLPQALVD